MRSSLSNNGVATSTVRCSSRTKAASADLRGVGVDAGDWGAGVGERGIAGGGGLARANGKPGAKVDELGEVELLAPLASLKWT
jgi:hypothetical protein